MPVLVKNDPIERLEDCRILITNDDGINAPGLKVLEKIARSLSKDVWVVAPEREQSGAGHSLTLSRPLRIRKISGRRYSIDGTPTDCVLFAVNQIMGKKKPQLVLSGVNYGSNLAEDITYSGTVAAAMEGTLLGIRSIAFSQTIFNRSHPPKWQTAQHFAPEIIRKLVRLECPAGILMNINFPDALVSSVRGVRAVAQGFREAEESKIIKNIDPRGKPYYWIGYVPEPEVFGVGTDLDAVNREFISVTPLHLDLTHYKTLSVLEETFS